MANPNTASAAIVHLDLFVVDEESVTESGRYKVFDGHDRRTGSRVTIKKAILSHPATESLVSVDDREFLRDYFVEVGNLVYSVHPSVNQLVGWNVKIGDTESEFTIVTKFISLNSIEKYDKLGVALSPTSRQILLYGLARCLRYLDKERLAHQDIQPRMIARDERGYPILLRVGQPSYRQTDSGQIIGGDPKYISPLVHQGMGCSGIDEFSYGSLFYLLTEDKEPLPEGCADEPEAIVAAVKNGTRPLISATNPYAELITALWDAGREDSHEGIFLLMFLLTGRLQVAAPPRGDVIRQVISHFDDPSKLQPNVNIAELYTYRGWLDYGEANLRKPPKSAEFIRKICQRPDVYEAILDRSRNMKDLLAGLLSWFDSSENHIDEERRRFLLPILTQKSTFDPWAIFKPEDRPAIRSVFTTAVQDLAAISDLQQVMDAADMVWYECTIPSRAAPVVLKKVLVPHRNGDSVDNMIRFFRELFSQLYIQHPTIHRMVGWNIKAESTPFEFCLFTEKMETRGLTFRLVRNLTETQKTIMFYGIARGMAYLHSLKILHRDLGFGSIMVDSENHPQIGNLWYAKGETNLAETLFEEFSLYRSPEVLAGEKFTFESDVYAYAVLGYEIIEKQTASLGKCSVPHMMKLVANGKRPVWTTPADEPRPNYLQQLIERMWNQNHLKRPTFQKIVHKLEDSKFWFPGTDATAFFRYKGYLDASEKLIESESIVTAEWSKQVSRLRKIETWMRDHEDDLIRVVIRVLCYVTTGSGASSKSQRQLLKQLLRTSFEQAKCIDGDRFRDYAFRYLSGVSIDNEDQVIVPLRAPQGFSLNPLTGSIFDDQSLTVNAQPETTGAFGRIFRAHRMEIDEPQAETGASQTATGGGVRQYAVKKLTPSQKVKGGSVDPAQENTQICNTFREIITQMYCQHPAVIQFRGWNYGRERKSDREPAHIILVTPWMDGGTLADGLVVSTKKKVVPDEKKLSDTKKMICLYGVARALAWAHLRGIIHRDIKAENVFLNLKKYPRLADFGLAKMHQEGIGMSIMKGGSLPYLAPEVLAGDERWSFAADVYAYAILFWEIIAGHRWEVTIAQLAKIPLAKVKNQNDEFRPPLDPIEKLEHQILLTRMWTWEIAKRPKFGDIAELLERREYWLPNTERGEFLRYIERMKRKEGQIPGDVDAGCRQLLSRVKMATSLTDFLNHLKIHGDSLDDFSAKIIYTLGYLCGHGTTLNEDVMAAARQSLANGDQYLDPVKINKQAAEVVNELDEDLDEEF
jgi:serine/threonine protein kinase